MDLQTSHMLMLVVCLSGMLLQLSVKQKQLTHLLFAIFCGSMAMSAAQKLSADEIGHYHYLIGLGTCATCNGSWLLVRAVFRNQGNSKAIEASHLILAGLIALLVMANQSVHFYVAGFELSSELNRALLRDTQTVIQELLQLLSSSILVMSFWEACRGFSSDTVSGKWQRVLFLVGFSTAVLSVTLLPEILDKAIYGDKVRAWLACYASIYMVILTQIIIRWRQASSPIKEVTVRAEKCEPDVKQLGEHNLEGKPTADKQPVFTHEHFESQALLALKQQLHSYVINQQAYLTPNLKVVDVASALNVSEYKISRVLKQHFNAMNFNQYINRLRVEHAKQILSDTNKQHWPVMVIGLESGFASVGPFTRAFKEYEGCTPGQYRKLSTEKVVIHG